MPFAESKRARIHYSDIGAGPAILTLHGFSETSNYWNISGVAGHLARTARLIGIDLRGHGRSVAQADNPGFDIDTLCEDIDHVADAAGIGEFALLGHATGSVVACRYATRHRNRASALALTNGASATAMVAPTTEENARFFSRIARFYARNEWDQIIEQLRLHPQPFLNGFSHSPRAEELWKAIETVFRQNDCRVLSRFATDFYTDPDPHLGLLRTIRIPTLVVTAQYDELMQRPGELLARTIPNAQARHMQGVGHMTALENPAELTAILEQFFHSC